mmetsp:Transcript_109985/g.350241  ORF Transcript_109985/g.350241 Transcript_109985/m.350241 type:complete len:684 (-) Transcript_109985:87-2138(-)
MKRACAALVLAAAAVGGHAASVTERLSPVTRVVELLKNLGAKVESELKSEEDLFETFECWARSVVSQKTASNAGATSRKESLTTYVADLDAGRIELTTERVDLEKEIDGLREDIEQAEGLRAKEKADFEAAKAEMQQAITALGKAIDVMDAGAKPASLLRLRSNINGQLGDSIQAREADAQGVTLVLEIARNSLSKADAMFLQRVLTAEVPVKDWKKLNRKADFKEKYVARSGDIQKTLTGLLEQFKSSLGDATAKEEKGAELHEKLMGAKGDQKSKAEGALSAMEVEGAARGLSKSEAEGEIEALGKQIEADEKYLKDTQSALATKTEEWKDRKQIRTDEIAAIGKAISVLHSDDARDLFKRSFGSQSFIQRVARNVVVHKVVASTGGRFDKVVESIDKMVGVLESEEGEDLKRKEGCEKARVEDTRKAVLLSRSMDELSDAVTRLKSEIEELNAQVKDKKNNIVSIEEQLKEAKRVRDDEHSEWLRSDADDRDAAVVVGNAIDVLKEFYAAKAGLVQKKTVVQRQPVEGIVSGAAPPPPPSTWDTPYSGKQDENTGIVSILTMVKDDIEKDQTKAKTEEGTSQKAYDTFKAENEQLIADLSTAISELKGTIADKAGDVQDNEKDRLTKRSELQGILKQIKDAAPGCDFFAVNFKTRLTNRQVELDGLKQAKQVLNGAGFAE